MSSTVPPDKTDPSKSSPKNSRGADKSGPRREASKAEDKAQPKSGKKRAKKKTDGQRASNPVPKAAPTPDEKPVEAQVASEADEDTKQPVSAAAISDDPLGLGDENPDATSAAAAGPSANGNGSKKSRKKQPKSARPVPVGGQSAGPVGTPPEEEETSGHRQLINMLMALFVSMIVHAAIFIMLALWILPEDTKRLFALRSDVPDEVEEIEEFEITEITMTEDEVLDTFETMDSNDLPQQLEQMDEQPEMSNSIDNPFDTIDFDSSFAEQTAPLGDLINRAGDALTSELSSRGESARRRMVTEGGGSDASERAVALALKWLAAHQREDGGWDFDHTRGPGLHRTSPNPGEAIMARNGATGLALLPFLGAGQTHQEGRYKEVVERGLKYLIRNQKPSAGAGSFHESQGNMYSHGICAIALTEAYAMTNDRDLIVPAQAALNFIVYAQDPVGGGWRYRPREAGDTSVVGWQLMALKSGYMGYLQVPTSTIRNAEKFLESVSLDSGAYYGYTGPNKGRATTAIGLLSRMYLGWDQEHPSLARGVEYLAEQGPSKTGQVDMYYNYYATQVMRHFGGEPWEEWNAQTRDWLVETQASRGAMEGSWFFEHPWAKRGGRMYCTAMACMILEVYYRHMPIYREQAAEEEFPL